MRGCHRKIWQAEMWVNMILGAFEKVMSMCGTIYDRLYCVAEFVKIYVHILINGFLGKLDFWLTSVWLDNHFIHADVKFCPSCLHILAKLKDKLCICMNL